MAISVDIYRFCGGTEVEPSGTKRNRVSLPDRREVVLPEIFLPSPAGADLVRPLNPPLDSHDDLCDFD